MHNYFFECLRCLGWRSTSTGYPTNPSRFNDSSKSSPHLRPNIEGSTRLAPERLMVIADYTSDEDLPNLHGASAAFEYVARPRLLECRFTNFYYPASNLGLERLIEIADQADVSANIQNCIGVCEDDIKSRKPHVGELSHWGPRIDGNLLHEAF